MTLQHDPRLGGSRLATQIKDAMTGLEACTRKQPFATPASRPLQRNTPTLESRRPDHDPQYPSPTS
jgi:hypothetical protein